MGIETLINIISEIDVKLSALDELNIESWHYIGQIQRDKYNHDVVKTILKNCSKSISLEYDIKKLGSIYLKLINDK